MAVAMRYPCAVKADKNQEGQLTGFYPNKEEK
jgi:hypothetical protein